MKKIIVSTVVINAFVTGLLLAAYDHYRGSMRPVVRVVTLSDKNKELLDKQRIKVQKLGFNWLSYKRPEDGKKLREERNRYKRMQEKAADAIARKAVQLVNSNQADIVISEDAIIAGKNRFVVKIQ